MAAMKGHTVAFSVLQSQRQDVGSWARGSGCASDRKTSAGVQELAGAEQETSERENHGGEDGRRGRRAREERRAGQESCGLVSVQVRRSVQKHTHA